MYRTFTQTWKRGNVSSRNPLLAVDVYKMGHMEQYAPGCSEVYSYLVARSDKTFKDVVFFGLQYYLREYLTIPLTEEMGEEFLKYKQAILKTKNSPDIENKIRALCKLGYFPVEIKSVKEGDVLPVKNVLMTIRSTQPGFHWVVGFIESLILKLWYPITVASCSYKYRKLVDKFFDLTVDEDLYWLKDFTVHDFGYRGDTTEEGAGISGGAHLLSFEGSDTVVALPFVENYYDATVNYEDFANCHIMTSVPASEHSVMCSFGRENELGAFEHMFDLYPTGPVSIVSDTFDIYKVLTEFAKKLKIRIIERDGKTIFRPDSGIPENIICGDPEAPNGSNEWKGAVRLLDEMFGSTMNSKGYKQINLKVGLIYGDGMYYERYEKVLKRLRDMGYASSNFVIGVGGILRNWTRDTLGFAIKATYVVINGKGVEIEKDPITDHGKKSHKGLLCLRLTDEGYVTVDQATKYQEDHSLLETIYKDGKIWKTYTFEEVRDRLKNFQHLEEFDKVYNDFLNSDEFKKEVDEFKKEVETNSENSSVIEQI